MGKNKRKKGKRIEGKREDPPVHISGYAISLHQLTGSKLQKNSIDSSDSLMTYMLYKESY